ncbi:hypothetical protein [Micromonospora chokoriensis]|uniref:hypothetical protein n=1 Tax=Micromonospora chokoriensis TaxID=356851 RepID=UPI0004C337EE|nr:hypothetical protein [Micromonospora chokoriensis]
MRDPLPSELPAYEGWRQVPPGLFSKTQLADLDFPRVVGGPVRAYVHTRDWNDRKTSVKLYRLSESVPSPASAAQLEAARNRSAPGARECQACGAYPDRPPASAGLCVACAQITRLQKAVALARRSRAEVGEWARTILDPLFEPAVVLRIEQVLRPPALSGRQNLTPVALRVDAVDATGRRLLDATIRLAGARVKAVPADALAPDDVAEQVRAVLGWPVLVTWHERGVFLLRDVYGIKAPGGWYGGNPNALAVRAAHWRGDLDPDTLHPRAAIDPGTADRMLLLLRRMAATEPPDSSAAP